MPTSQAVDPIQALTSLALDLRWTWLRSTYELWAFIDRDTWQATHNPWYVLQSASPERIAALAADPPFAERLRAAVREREVLEQQPAWFTRTHPDATLGVAYFCMEFGLTEAIPIYAGGLGVLAGDHLKAACELGVPLVAVGLLYYGGYFRQSADAADMQRELYPPVDPAWLPLQRVLDPAAGRLAVQLPLPGRSVTLRAWRAQIGPVRLYLLDANDPVNGADDRRITASLYGGDNDVRLRQELALGVGGWRLLRALGIAPDVCHLNEGHASFAILERAASLAHDRGWPFARALAVTRAGNVFTTHTAVMAGFDRFDRALLEPYLEAYARDSGLDAEALWELGVEPASGTFNMAHLAIHTCGSVNAVSRLHGDVSRHLFSRVFPRWPPAEIPVGYVTNGVHQPTWESPEAHAIMVRGVADTSEDDLWAMRAANRARLVATVRERTGKAFDPQILTIGWARRFAAYKRPTLMLHDPARLTALLTNTERPVQVVVAGKAHPRDDDGKALLREWLAFARRPEVEDRIAVLLDYDMGLAQSIVQGVDVWLNTPRRPWEASGTSGMKVVVNGGLNLSEDDGWWAEAHNPDVGWTFALHGDEEEGNALYELLETDVVPEFYQRGDVGLPRSWLARVRTSMRRLGPRFSADRMVREYTERYYLPAATRYRRRLADDGAVADAVLDWSQAIDGEWDGVRFERANLEPSSGGFDVEVVARLGELDPHSVRVELFAHPFDGASPERFDLGRAAPVDDAPGAWRYRAHIATMWPAEHYTARIVPWQADARIPLEQAHILWER